MQGMPKQIEAELIKMIKNFVWNSKSHPLIGLEMPCLPHERGEKKLLNLEVRNKAIKCKKMKRYLAFGPTRPA